MTTLRDLTRATVSLTLSVLMAGASVAVPLLEQGELASEPVAESEHNPSTCPTAHDHTVCTQVSANASAPTPVVDRDPARAVLAIRSPSSPSVVRSTGFLDGHPSRAPPLA